MLSAIKLKIMVRAFKIRLAQGEDFDIIASSYNALNQEDIERIRAEVKK